MISNFTFNVITRQDTMNSTGEGLTFLVPCNESFANCLTNGIQLGSVTTTLHTDADVHLTVPVGTKEQDRLPNLKSERLWLHQLNWHTIDLDEPFALLHECDSDSLALTAESLNSFHVCREYIAGNTPH